jgi:excisionase family DNA binding protein
MEQSHTDQPLVLLVTVEEAARRLSIGRSHLYKYLQRRELQSVKLGRSCRIAVTDLDAFVAARRAATS